MRSASQRVLDTPPSGTISIADHVSRLRHRGVEVLDFSAGRAAEHTPDYICRAASQALLSGDTHQSMAQGKPEFREACAQKLSRENGLDADPEKNIIATFGCKHGLNLALMATLNPGDEVLVEDPCFVSYRPAVRLWGGAPVNVPLRPENRFRWTREDLESAVTDRTRAILFCSPHNPTGTVHDEKDLEVIAELAEKHDLLVLSDEIYERATWGGRRHTCIATMPGIAERSITIMGFTKTFSMGGWRIGFNIAPEPILSAMVRMQQHMITGAGSFVQAGAAVAIADAPSSDVEALWSDWGKRIDWVVSEVNQIPNLSCHRPEGGFYAWIDIRRTGRTSETLANELLEKHHLAFIPGTAFGPGGEGYLRMTCVRSWEDLRAGIPRLAEALS
jgi:aspartate/methionine/tyrosine aminotransferase